MGAAHQAPPFSFAEGSRTILIPMDLVLADFDDAGLREHLFARDGTIENLLDTLDEIEDVQDVFHNADI